MTEDVWRRSSLSQHRVPRRSPWCPAAEDGRFMLAAAVPALAQASAPTLLVLGVTPEVIALDWSAAARQVTIDSSAGTIASSWQPNPRVASQAICAWWQEMPLETASIAAAVGDGSLNALTSFAEYPVVLAEAARVLRPDGLLVARCFLKPERRETPEDVMALALRGEFPIMSGFRFRLAMALAGQDGSMALGQVPETIDRLAPDREALGEATGWTRAEIDLSDTGAGSPIRITFPTEAELGEMIAPHFELIDMQRGSYTQAEHCPTVTMRRR